MRHHPLEQTARHTCLDTPGVDPNCDDWRNPSVTQPQARLQRPTAASRWHSAASRAIAPSLSTEQLLSDPWPLEVAKDGRVTDAVVGGNGAEGFLHRAAPDQFGVWDKPAKAARIGPGVRWELGVV